MANKAKQQEAKGLNDEVCNIGMSNPVNNVKELPHVQSLCQCGMCTYLKDLTSVKSFGGEPVVKIQQECTAVMSI